MICFPILEQPRYVRGIGEARTEYILFSVLEPHREQAAKNHGQTLERLAERGGLSWVELIAVLEDRAWTRMDEVEAESQVRKIIANNNLTFIS